MLEVRNISQLLEVQVTTTPGNESSIETIVHNWAFGSKDSDSEGFESFSLKGVAALHYLSEFSGKDIRLQ